MTSGSEFPVVAGQVGLTSRFTKLLGRLAVDRACGARGLGEYLLMDALRRALVTSREVDAVAVIVDAKDDDAVAFYQRYGFVPFADARQRLFLPMRTIERLFA
jgi:predicted GNAT family N-acyltransferase